MLVQEAQAAAPTNATSFSVTLNSPTTQGNSLVVCIGTDGSSANPVVSTVTLGGNADNFASVTSNNTNEGSWIWVDPNCTGGQTTVTINTTTGSGTLQMLAQVMEFSSVLSPSPVDKTSSGTSASSTSWSSLATATTAQDNELIIGTVFAFHSGGPAPVISGPASAAWINIAGATSPGNFAMMSGYSISYPTGAFTYNGTTTAACA